MRSSDFGKFGDGELAGCVVDAGDADLLAMAANGGEIVRALVVEEGVVVDRAGGEDACDLA
jgi:hypothetical protein